MPQAEPLFAIVLSDILRKDVDQTLDYFRNEGVDIKIISGDHVTELSRANAREMLGLAEHETSD